MRKRALCILLALCVMHVPAMAQENADGILREFAGKLFDRIQPEKTPDPYLWLYEQETTRAVMDDLPGIAQTLRSLGISDVTEQVENSYRQMTQEVITLMSEHGHEYEISRGEMALGLLFAAGSAKKEAPSFVYAFDAEFDDVENMYRDFLSGIERIGCGELKFDHIAEDLSGVDGATGDGTRKISFEFRGKTATYQAVAQHDWFDAGMLGFMHELMGAGDSGKELYFVFDGMQGVVLFYQTPQWVKEFTQATGCPLFTSMN
ncbi:MAG: hypothetical protein IKU34_09230 [Clostridia bacterium]|nr:hypothetical protein [Clostridia bacterium]